jgi:hypothetical protein
MSKVKRNTSFASDVFLVCEMRFAIHVLFSSAEYPQLPAFVAEVTILA